MASKNYNALTSYKNKLSGIQQENVNAALQQMRALSGAGTASINAAANMPAVTSQMADLSSVIDKMRKAELDAMNKQYEATVKAQRAAAAAAKKSQEAKEAAQKQQVQQQTEQAKQAEESDDSLFGRSAQAASATSEKKQATGLFKGKTQKEQDWTERTAATINGMKIGDRAKFERYQELSDIITNSGLMATDDAGIAEADRVATAARRERKGIEKELKKSYSNFDDILRYKQMQANAASAKGAKAEAQRVAESGVLNSVGANLASIPLAAVGGVLSAADLAVQKGQRILTGSDAPIDPNTGLQRVGQVSTDLREATAESLASNGKTVIGKSFVPFVYQTAMSGADSLAASMLPGGAALLGVSAGTQSARDALQAGANGDQALLFGTVAGIAEGLFEKISIGNLKAFKENPAPAAAKEMFMNIAKSVAVNASEEAATQIADDAAEAFILGDKSNWAAQYESAYNLALQEGYGEKDAKSLAVKAAAKWAAGDILTAAAGGALMGGAFGALGTAGQLANRKLADATRAAEKADVAQAKADVAAQEAAVISAETQNAEQVAAQAAQQMAVQQAEAEAMQAAETTQTAIPSQAVQDVNQNVQEAVQPQNVTETAQSTQNAVTEKRFDTERYVNRGMSEEAAAVMEKGYKDSMDATLYGDAVELAYNAGYNGMNEVDADRASAAARAILGEDISQTTKQAYEAGKAARKAESANEKLENSGLRFADKPEGMTIAQDKTVQALASRTGRKVRYVENAPFRGRLTDGEVLINSKLGAGEAMMATLGHEVTHATENSKLYADLRNLVETSGIAAEWAKGKGYDSVTAMAEATKERYKDSLIVERDGKQIEIKRPELRDGDTVLVDATIEDGMPEVVADFFGEVLMADEATVQRLAKEHRNVIEVIRDFISDIIEKLHGGNRAELRKALRMYEKALSDNDSKYDAFRAAPAEAAVDARLSLGIKDNISDSSRDLAAENLRLREQVERLKGEFKLTKGHVMDEKAVKNVAKKLLKDANSKYDKAKLETQLTALFNYIANGDPDWDSVMDASASLAKSILSQSVTIEPSLREQDSRYDEMYRGTATVYATAEEIKRLEAAYGKRAFGRIGGILIKESDTGKGLLDHYYNELDPNYGEILHSEPNTVEDAFEVLREARSAVNEKNVQYGYGMGIDEAAYDMAQEIFEEYLNVPKVHAKEDGIETVDYAEEIASLRNQFHASRAETLEAQVAAYAAELESTKELYKKEHERYRRAVASKRASKKKAQIKRKQIELRGKIKKVSTDLASRLTHPTESKHIPVQLVQSVANICDTMAVIMGDNETAKKGKETNFRRELAEMRRQYDALRNDSDYSLAAEWNSEISDYLNQLESVSNKAFTSMSVDELDMLYKAVRNVQNIARTYNKALTKEYVQGLSESRSAAASELRSAKKQRIAGFGGALNAQVLNYLTPQRLFARLGGYKGGVWNQMYKSLNEASLNRHRMTLDSNDFFSSVASDKRVKTFSGKNAERITLETRASDGTKVKVQVTPAMLANMVDVWNHNPQEIKRSGFTIPDLDMYYGGETRADSYGRGTKILPEASELDAWRKMLDGYATEWMQALTDQNRYIAPKMRKVQMAVSGFTTIGTNDHRTLFRDKAYVVGDTNAMKQDLSLQNMGFTKRRIEGAAQPILVMDIADYASRVVNDTVTYASMTEALRDFGKVYDGKVYTGQVNAEGLREQNKSLKGMVTEWYGSAATKYIENLLGDLKNQPRGDGSRLLGTLLSNQASAALSMNIIGTPIKQSPSIFAASSVIGMQPIMRTLSGKNHHYQMSKADIRKYTPLLALRNLEGGSQELAALKSKGGISGFTSQLPGSKLISFVDETTVKALWSASADYVHTKHPGMDVNSADFKKAVAEVFNRCVQETQPNYSTLQRSEMQRSGNMFYRILGQFKTQPIQNGNLIYDAVNEYKATRTKEAKTRMVDTLTGQAVQAVAFAVLANVGRGIMHSFGSWRDDEDEITAASVAGAVVTDTVTGVAGMIPGLSEAIEIAQGYDYSNVTTDLINVPANAVRRLYSIADKIAKGETTFADEAGNIVNNGAKILDLTGLPASSSKRLVNAIISWAEDLYKGDLDSAYESTASTMYGKLYKAIEAGDSAAVTRATKELTEAGKTQDDIEAGLRTILKGNADIQKAAEAYAKNGGVNRTYIDVVSAYRDKGFKILVVSDAVKSAAQKITQDKTADLKESLVAESDKASASNKLYQSLTDEQRRSVDNAVANAASDLAKAKLGYGQGEGLSTARTLAYKATGKNDSKYMRLMQIYATACAADKADDNKDLYDIVSAQGYSDKVKGLVMLTAKGGGENSKYAQAYNDKGAAGVWQYAQYRSKADADGNGNISQGESAAYLSGADMSAEMKRYLYKLGHPSAKTNPF